jgi:hypothetical protein
MLWTLQLQVSLSHATLDAKFQSERNESLSSLIAAARAEVQEERTNKMQLQALYVKLQKQLAERDSAILSMHQELTDAVSNVAVLRAEKDALVASEARLAREVAMLAEDRERQGRLLDSLRDLEHGLQAHESEQRKQLEVGAFSANSVPFLFAEPDALVDACT